MGQTENITALVIKASTEFKSMMTQQSSATLTEGGWPPFVTVVCPLGLGLDSQLLQNDHIARLTGTAFFHLCLTTERLLFLIFLFSDPNLNTIAWG